MDWFLAVNNLITYKTQIIFYLTAKYSGFINYILNNQD